MPLYKAEAIVIRRANLGESDRLVTLFCREQGKVPTVARGARKPKSRFAGRLEPFNHVRVLLATGRTLDVVSQVEVLDAFAGLREDLDRLGQAAFVLELVDRATTDRQPAPDIFSLLRVTLDLLARGDPELVAIWFTARLLVLSGYAPVIGRCQVCGRPVVGAAAISFPLGGTLCGDHRSRDPDAVEVSAGGLGAVGYLLESSPASLGRISLAPRLRAELAGLLQRYIEYRLETKLKSPLVIRKLTGTGNRERGTGKT